MSLKALFIELFIFIPHNYLLHYMEELCEAGFSAITASVFCLPGEHNVSQQSTYACSASHLQGKKREKTPAHTQSSMSQRISAFSLFFFSSSFWIHNTVVLLISSHCVTAPRFLWLWILQ